MRRPFKLFVFVLIVLCVVLLGFIAGRGCKHREMKPGHHIMTLLDRSSLPESKRYELKEKLRATFPTSEMREAKRRFHEEAVAILEADEFDAAAYRTLLNKTLEQRHLHKKQMAEVIAEIASELNKEERKALAQVFRRSPKFKKNPHR